MIKINKMNNKIKTNFDRLKTLTLDEFIDEILLNVPDEQDTRYIFGSWMNRRQLKEYLEKPIKKII